MPHLQIDMNDLTNVLKVRYYLIIFSCTIT